MQTALLLQNPLKTNENVSWENVENANRTFAPKPFENKHFWRVEIWESLGNDDLAGNPLKTNGFRSSK